MAWRRKLLRWPTSTATTRPPQHARVEVDDIFSEVASQAQMQAKGRPTADSSQAVAKPSQKQINQLKKRCRSVTLDSQQRNSTQGGAARKSKPGKGAVLAASVGQFQARGLLTDTGLTRTVKMMINGPDSDLEFNSENDIDSDVSEGEEGRY